MFGAIISVPSGHFHGITEETKKNMSNYSRPGKRRTFTREKSLSIRFRHSTKVC
jgi:hypothetical protein